MEKIIMIKSYIKWNSIARRKTWNIIKNSFLNCYENWMKIDLKFTGIERVSHSFIDELIGVFIFYDKKEALKKISFSDCNEKIKEMIRFVVKDKLK